MDDGEVELSDHGFLPSPDELLDEFLKNTRTCTHTHTCNPPGPDAAHTHTCYHTHTQVFPSEEDDPPPGQERPVAKPRRPSGNREAVRKYREKKKAHTAYLEEEVKKLRLFNQQLTRKLQGQALLEAEISRLRGLLLDLRGKIDNELAVYPFQKLCNSTTSFKEGDCGVQSNGSGMSLQCENDMQRFHPDLGASVQVGNLMASWEENCRPAVIDCRANTSDVVSAEGCPFDAVETMLSSASQAE